MNWQEGDFPVQRALTIPRLFIAFARALPVICVILFGLVLMLVLRLIERPLFGVSRPITPYITQYVCRLSLFFIGVRLRIEGKAMNMRGAVVSNHCSWLDIFVLNAFQRVYFVSKAEVSSWPFIGQLAQATGTAFIERNPRKAGVQKQLFRKRLLAGHKLLFFPEGTSTDGLQVIPFKSSLFAAFYEEGLKDVLYIQPVTLIYKAPEGEDPRFYGWWGDMSFAGHLLHTLCCPKRGAATVVFNEPIRVKEIKTRKELAALSEDIVRKAHSKVIQR